MLCTSHGMNTLNSAATPMTAAPMPAMCTLPCNAPAAAPFEAASPAGFAPSPSLRASTAFSHATVAGFFRNSSRWLICNAPIAPNDNRASQKLRELK